MNTKAIIDNDTGESIPEETQKAIAEMNRVSAGIAALCEQYAHEPDCSTEEGYALAKSEQKEIAKVRIKIEKAHKSGKAYYLEGGRRVDAMKNEILESISPLEDARKAAVKAVDDEAERVARVAAEAEQARIESIEAGIAKIRSNAQYVALGEVEQAIARLETWPTAVFDEFQDNATAAITETLEVLRPRLEALQAQADEATRLEAVKAEQEAAAAKMAAQQAELDRRQKEIDDAKAAQIAEDDRREREKQEAIEAEQKRKDDEAAEKQRQIEQEARDRALAEQAERDKAEALKAAESKRLADIEAAKQQAIADEQARVEADRKKAERLKAKQERDAAKAPDQDKMVAWLSSVPQIPAMKTDEWQEVAKQVSRLLDQVTDLISVAKVEVSDESEAA